jgi:dTDP-L-rhamnose 4-epimerase
VAEALGRELGWTGGVEVTGKFRAGDVRHCYADVTRIAERLGYAPRVTFEQGVGELVRWVAEQQGVQDAVATATGELLARGLAR